MIQKNIQPPRKIQPKNDDPLATQDPYTFFNSQVNSYDTAFLFDLHCKNFANKEKNLA